MLVEPFLARPETAGVFSDFDGTLSPIVDEPDRARPLPEVPDLLARLARHFGRVGVVSGRPVSFLRHHVGDEGLWLSGIYGLETIVNGEVVVPDEVNRWRPVVEAVADRAEADGWPPALVERKGLSVTLHFRVAPERRAEAQSWARAAAATSGLAVMVGRQSFELRPPLPRDKGTALADAVDGLQAVCFLGDDRGDLDAFDVLDRLEANGVAALRVGVRSDEAPDELLERADALVDGPRGSVELLEQLLG